MTEFSRKKAILLAIVLTLVLTAGAGIMIGLKLMRMGDYRDEIVAEVEKSLGRRVFFETMNISYRFGPAFTFSRVTVKEKDGLTDFVTADRLTFKLALIPLLQGKVTVHDLLMDNPRISILRDREGTFNFDDLLQGKGDSDALQISGISIENGHVRVADQLISPQGTVTTLENVNLSLGHLGRGKHTTVKLAAVIADPREAAKIKVTGSMKVAPHHKPLADTTAHLKVHAAGLDTGRFWPYYQEYVPFRQIQGRVDIDGSFRGRLRDFTSKGTVRLAGLRFDYRPVFHAILTPKAVEVKYDFELSPRDVTVKSVNVVIDGVNVKGSCAIKDIDTPDPRITAEAVTSPIPLETFGGYIPYGIIEQDVSQFIEQHIKGGVYRLDQGRLDGRVSQILNMGKGENYNVLYIKGRVEKGLVTYGRSVPTFNSIHGVLEMRGKDFNLHRMSGKFGSSPFTLEGKITDYPIDAPSGYPFSMNMIPRQPEVTWLLGWLKPPLPVLNGDSILRLKGEGFTSGYNLSGDWDLTTASYSYSDLLNKPAGRANTISFRGSVNANEAKIASLKYNLAPLSLSLAASYTYAPKEALTLDLRSNQFQVEQVASVFPAIRKYQPSGKVNAVLHGESSGGKAADLDLSWSGRVAMAGCGIKATEHMKPFSGVTGTINFGGSTLESSHLTARIGSSMVHGKGTLQGFDDPSLTLSFSSPSIDLADLGYRVPNHAVRIEKVRGEIALRNKEFQIRSLSARVGDSSADISGNIRYAPTPKADLVVTSPRLNLDDILMLTAVEPAVKTGAEPAPPTIKASISAETGTAAGLELAKIFATVMYDKSILHLQPVECQVLGGRMNGTARADFSTTIPKYQVGFQLVDLAAERVMKALGVKKQELTGTLSAQGQLSAKGNSASELEKSVTGSIKFRCENGSLRRFAVLSKIFSILNVSQLLKFRLPDMISGGMPYNHVTGTLSVRDGIIASNDLYMASNSINISAVGSLDLVRDEIHATIGVQPLQTIDKVVSNIPIFGWLLTGKDRSLITAYFEAKGKIEDPSVSAIPVKAMAKGVLNIFKRLFELPGKLITDTGEVIIGN